MRGTDLQDYSNAYIIVKRRISDTGANFNDRKNEKLIFKTNAPFRLCKTKINNRFLCDAEDLILLCQCIICWNIVTIIP